MSVWSCGSPHCHTAGHDSRPRPDQDFRGQRGTRQHSSPLGQSEGLLAAGISSPHGHFEPVLFGFSCGIRMPSSKDVHHGRRRRRRRGVRRRHQSGSGLLGYPGHTIRWMFDAWREGNDPLKGLEKTPPLHDIFYRIKGPAVADVIANFVERYNGASIPHADVTSDAVPPVTADQIPQVPNGIEVQVLRTIAPNDLPRDTEWRQGNQGSLSERVEWPPGKEVWFISKTNTFSTTGLFPRFMRLPNEGPRLSRS